jgi:hypothetical protein
MRCTEKSLGVAELDRASRSKFGSAFLDLDEQQQDEYLQSIEGALDRKVQQEEFPVR